MNGDIDKNKERSAPNMPQKELSGIIGSDLKAVSKTPIKASKSIISNSDKKIVTINPNVDTTPKNPSFLKRNSKISSGINMPVSYNTIYNYL